MTMTVTQALPWVHNDGGRADAGFKGSTGDCVVRAIAIAEERPYRDVYNDLFEANKKYASTSRSRKAKNLAKKGGTPRTGNYPEVYRPYLEGRGWTWVPTMQVGQGTTVHLRQGELPMSGNLIVSVSRHVVAVKDGMIHDNHDPAREGMRAVYGYFTRDASVTPPVARKKPLHWSKREIDVTVPISLTHRFSAACFDDDGALDRAAAAKELEECYSPTMTIWNKDVSEIMDFGEALWEHVEPDATA